MKYKNQIWEYFIKYTEEKRFLDFQEMKGKVDVLPFYDMEMNKFERLLNTFRWLTRFNLGTVIHEYITKPSNDEILEAIEIIKQERTDLLAVAKKYKDKQLRDNLIKKAKKSIECANYYEELVSKDYFKDKEI